MQPTLCHTNTIIRSDIPTKNLEFLDATKNLEFLDDCSFSHFLHRDNIGSRELKSSGCTGSWIIIFSIFLNVYILNLFHNLTAQYWNEPQGGHAISPDGSYLNNYPPPQMTTTNQEMDPPEYKAPIGQYNMPNWSVGQNLSNLISTCDLRKQKILAMFQFAVNSIVFISKYW